MASNIDSSSIDAEYPVAGRDNDSQGFRDNFSTIKNSLAAAKAEIEDIQSKAVLKDALTDSTLENNMAGSLIIDADFQQSTFKGYIGGTIDADTTISFINGHYQKVTVAGTLSITLADWPTSERFGTMRIELIDDGTARDITFNGAVGAIKTDGDAAWTGSALTTPADTDVSTIIEFFTNDGGVTIFARYLGQFS